MELIAQIVQTKRNVEAELLALPGVTGVDVGYKEVGGVLTDQIAVRVHVAKKKDRVPAAQQVPKEIDGIVTDVLERTYELQVVRQAIDVSAMADTTHYATLQGGVSMGPTRVIGGSIFAGTLGAIVIDNGTNQHAALTNFHVACVDAGWHAGDRMVQPSRIDTGVPPGDEFGAILRATLSGHVDGALVSIDAGHANSCTIAEIGAVKGTKTATLGMAVRKRGRTTGLTYGSVDGLAGTVNVNYGPSLGTRTLTNQISIRSDTTRNALFSDHGDSGSVIVDDSGYIVGLLFAGSGSNTVANQIADVLSELNISVCTGGLKIKDHKELIKDTIKDTKEFLKERAKEKEFSKDLLKDRIKDVIKDSKEWAKDIRDIPVKREFESPPDPRRPVDGPFNPGGPAIPGAPGIRSDGASLEGRLAALEGQLSALASFIGSELRPDLVGGAFAGAGATDEVGEMRAALEQQAADAAEAKASFDARFQ